MSAELLFVYGTLRRDAEGLQNPLLGDARFAGEATTTGRLVAVGPYRALVPGGEEIAGELYEVSPAQWRTLDAYEGDDYGRVVIDVTTSAGSTVRAWAYVPRSTGSRR